MEVCGFAGNGKVALEEIQAKQPDICLLDICMPILNGLALMEKIREIRPTLICIVVSGYDEFEYAQKAVQLEAFDYILKPVDETKLEHSLRRAKQRLDESSKVCRQLTIAKKMMQDDMPILREQLVADHCVVNPSYLSRIFKAEMDCTVIDYLTKMRMQQAIKLLEHTDKKVYEIAEQIGYKSQHYFCMAFKEVMKDDRVIDEYFDVPYAFSTTGWGVDIIKDGGDHGGSFKMRQAIENYEADFPKVHYPEIIIDWEESNIVMELAQKIFGDILKVRRKHNWWWTLGMTWDFINLRGLQPLMMDTLLQPEWLHRLMNLLCEGQLARLDFLEQNGLLSTNTGNTYVGSGGFGFTDDLNNNPASLTTMDMWGFVESQETIGISPDAYGEFIYPYHKKTAERFGLNCYGCCEPTNVRWDYVKNLPRLRRVSYSPWAKWELAPEHLGKNYIASVKPMATPLALGAMDEDAVRSDIHRALSATKDCITELMMKDNNTFGNCPQNASRWVELVREEIDKIHG